MVVTYNVRKGRNKEKCDDSALIGSETINNMSGTIDRERIDRVCIGDGVGGNAGGDEASLFVMEHIAGVALQDSNEEMKKTLLAVNDSLLEYAGSVFGHELMATTITGLFFGNSQAKMIHCGNTRIYALQGSFLKQITSDQTTYQWLIATGNADAAEHCSKSEIRGAFGGGSPKYAETLIVDDVFERGIPPLILMTSDGIHDVLDIDEIEDIVADCKKSSLEKTNQLIDAAVAKGSQDDCTAILIEAD